MKIYADLGFAIPVNDNIIIRTSTGYDIQKSNGPKMDNIFEVHNKNAYVGEEIEITEGVVVRFIYLDRRPWIQAALIIQENTRIKDVEKHFSTIKKSSRDTLGNIIGSNLQLFNLEIIYDLYLLSEQGLKPAELAKRLNYDFLAVVHTVISKETGEVDRNDRSWLVFHSILEDLKIGWDDRHLDEALKSRYEEIQAGTISFNLRSYPIDNEVIDSRLKTLRLGIKGARIFPTDPPMSPIEGLEAHLFLEGSYEKLNQTIMKHNKTYWARHKKWIEERMLSILEMIETSSNEFITRMRDKY